MTAPSIDHLLELDRQGRAKRVAGRGNLRVLEAEGFRWLHSGGRAIQAVMGLSAPARPCLASTRHLLAALLWHQHPEQVLNLGLGGGCIERFLHAWGGKPVCRSVDASGEVVALARAGFGLPPGEVIVARVEAHLADDPASYGLVVCDLFEGEQEAPCLADPVFVARLASRVAPDGVLALNLSPPTESALLAVLLPLRRHLPWVILCTSPGCGNVGVLASRRPPPEAAVLLARAASLGRDAGVDFTELAGRFRPLPPSLSEEYR
ncbi:MAG: hypothetical protein KDG55_02535 [Rhodocyclaceae bacterium]|nr:hypothetical protein [Rhodocyclaceae bacterium]